MRYFPFKEDTQIKIQNPKMSIDDLYFFCTQSLIATLNFLAPNKGNVHYTTDVTT